jgi:hypothetical protein
MDEENLLLKNINSVQEIFSKIFNLFSYSPRIAAE